MSPSGGPHGSATSRISFYVNGLVYGDELGETFAAETGFFVEQDPGIPSWRPTSRLCPRSVCLTRCPRVTCRSFPTLRSRTRSPNDTKREVSEKVEEWLTAGVRLVWVVEPEKRTITTHRLGREGLTFTAGETVDGEDVLPGLAVPLDLIFPPRRN